MKIPMVIYLTYILEKYNVVLEELLDVVLFFQLPVVTAFFIG
jgi:hypothetical protein